MKTNLGNIIRHSNLRAVKVKENRAGDEMWDVLCACGHMDKVPPKLFYSKNSFKDGKPRFYCRACSRRVKES